jgi:hypothetical protein
VTNRWHQCPLYGSSDSTLCAISLINKGRLMAFLLLFRFPSDDSPGYDSGVR